jgi:hypothetical protein
MQVITLAKTKELLGITGTASDAAITAKLPIIDAKVKLSTRNNWEYKFGGDTIIDSNIISVYSLSPDYQQNFVNYWQNNGYWYNKNVSGICNPFIYSDISESLSPGQLITGDNIPADSYITEITTNGGTLTVSGTEYYVTYITISANATATATGSILTGGISIGYQDIIAKGVQYLMTGTSTALPGTGIASRGVGPLSVSFSQVDQKIDGATGMPAWFAKGLPRYQRGF